MFKALAWKEWREQRPVVLAALLLTLLLPLLVAFGKSMLSGGVDLGAVAYDCTMLYGALLWPLTALLAGSGTISGEAQGGTLPFLFTRPVRRTTIWMVKVAAGVAVLLLVAVASGLFARLMVALTGGGAGSFLAGSEISRLLEGNTRNTLLYVALFLLFASAVFFSTFIAKPLLGAGAALALSFGVLVVVVTLQVRLNILLGQNADWLLVEVVLLGVLLLVISLYRFARGEMVQGSGRRIGQGLLGLALVLVVSLISLPVMRAFPRLVPGEARISAALASPDGRQLLMAVNGRISPVGRLWSLESPGHDLTRLTGIMSGPPAFTPDGQGVVYLGVESLNGKMSLRKMRPDGTDDDLLTMLPRFAPFAVQTMQVSPDGQLVAAAGMVTMAVVRLDGSAVPAWYGRELGPQDYIRLVGWTPDSRELIFLVTQRGADVAGEPMLMRALDVNSGERRTIGELPPRSYLASGWDPRAGVRRVPLTTTPDRKESAGGRYRFALTVVDVKSGRQDEITANACWWDNVSMTADGRRLAYAVCEPEGEDAHVREVHLRDLQSGEDQILSSMNPWLGRVLLSPDGATVLAAACEDPVTEAPRLCTTSILVPGDPSRAFPEGWWPLAWAGQDQVYLSDDLNAPRRVALGSVKSGELEVILP